MTIKEKLKILGRQMDEIHAVVVPKPPIPPKPSEWWALVWNDGELDTCNGDLCLFPSKEAAEEEAAISIGPDGEDASRAVKVRIEADECQDLFDDPL